MTTLIPQAEQSGTVASRPVWLPHGAASVSVQAVLNGSDVASGATALGLAILWTFDAAQVAHAASCTWQGGPDRSAPSLRMPVPPGALGFAGQLVIPTSLDVGLAIEIDDNAGNPLPLNIPAGLGVAVETPIYPVLTS
jgi:hypothetical protein